MEIDRAEDSGIELFRVFALGVKITRELARYLTFSRCESENSRREREREEKPAGNRGTF